ncbi:MAG: phosphoenolpyruvate carboxykinase (ATP), partial [Elusimicrobiota bacterium]|nr:phosphoenolpyruvate carboxykinase (ATP) [Elusimicrobiota bacterium]
MKAINPKAFESQYGLEEVTGISTTKTIYWNLTAEQLYEEALKRGEGSLTRGGAFSVNTGKHTGRSPNDRFFVQTPDVKDKIWWHKGNKGISEENFDKLFAKAQAYAKDKDLFVRDAYVGADKNSAMPVRVVNEFAWHNHFAKNMFIEPAPAEVASVKPSFSVIYLPGLNADPKTDGTASETAIVLNFKKRVVLIIGTAYAGESKKCIF